MAKPPTRHPILQNDNRHHDFPSHPVRHGEEENNRERQSQPGYSLAHLTTNPRTLLCALGWQAPPSQGKPGSGCVFGRHIKEKALQRELAKPSTVTLRHPGSWCFTALSH